MGLRSRSNEASRLFARKPFRRRPLGYGGQAGRRVFCLCAALARSLQPTTGMLLLRRLAHSQNPSPQHPAQFSDRLSETFPGIFREQLFRVIRIDVVGAQDFFYRYQ